MKKPKILLAAAICLMLVAATITGYTFAGAGDAPGKEELSIEEEIIHAHYDPKDAKFKEYYPIENFSLRFRGTFSDTYVVFLDGPYVHMEVLTTEVVAGIEFTFPDSHTMLAYHQGTFYSLKDAYDQSLLTMDDVLKLKEDYNVLGAKLSEKGTVPTTRHPCTHTHISVSESDDAFSYIVSDAQYFYTGIDETRNVTVFAIRSVDELERFIGIERSDRSENHNDSFFAESSLIVINYSVDKSPFNILVRGAAIDTNGILQLEMDSYAVSPISYLSKTGSIVLEVNRIVDDAQVKHTITSHNISEDTFSELFPDDPIHPVFQPEGLPMNDNLDYLEGFMEGHDNWYARAATSFYDTPADVNLYDMFRDAYPTYTDFTDAELAFLNATFLGSCIGNMDIVKIPTKEMNSVLLQYFETALDQTNQVGMDNMVYFPDTDCYYCVSNDVASAPLFLHSYYYHAGNHIYYEIGESDNYPEYVMTVEYVDSKPVIISNKPIS